MLTICVGAEQPHQERPETTLEEPPSTTTPPRGSSPAREPSPAWERSPAREQPPAREPSPARGDADASLATETATADPGPGSLLASKLPWGSSSLDSCLTSPPPTTFRPARHGLDGDRGHRRGGRARPYRRRAPHRRDGWCRRSARRRGRQACRSSRGRGG